MTSDGTFEGFRPTTRSTCSDARSTLSKILLVEFLRFKAFPLFAHAIPYLALFSVDSGLERLSRQTNDRFGHREGVPAVS